MKNLRKLREAKGLSQQKLAEYFTVSQQSIYKYENGLAEPDLATLKKMADFFQTSIDYLIGFSDFEHIENVILSNRITEKELQHLAYYRQLSEESRKSLDVFLDSLIK